MKRFPALFLLIFVSIGLAAQQAPDFPGSWLGTISVGAVRLRVVFHLKDGPGGMTGTMDSLDQNVKGIPISSVALDGHKIAITLPMGKYEGTLDGAPDSMRGTWFQGGSEIPLDLQRVKDAGALELKRPQNPTKPYPYREEEVAYENKGASVKLAGTLTIPQGSGPFPAVLLITGSGAQDRDESLMGHRPFLVLADHLTRKGIAVLRVDDRGMGRSGGNPVTATTADFATDVEAGIAFLKTKPEIDAKRIGLVGHSEGGMIAPMVAARNPGVAFIVMMAGPGVRGDEIIVAQTAALARASGAAEEIARSNAEEERAVLAIVTAEPDKSVADRKLRERLAGKVPEGELGASIKMLTSPWYRYFLTYDPAQALAKVKCPVLAINGEKDLQISAHQNLPAIRKALAMGGNKDVETIELPGLNHLLQTAKTGLVSEYGEIEETISPAALDVMSGWILKHVGTKTQVAK
jgi:pimeloyl-ACP methyl ester carboxylesterase